MPDMYVELAVKALSITHEQVDGEMRVRIKSVLFAWCYGYVAHSEDEAIKLLQANAAYILRGVTTKET